MLKRISLVSLAALNLVSCSLNAEVPQSMFDKQRELAQKLSEYSIFQSLLVDYVNFAKKQQLGHLLPKEICEYYNKITHKENASNELALTAFSQLFMGDQKAAVDSLQRLIAEAEEIRPDFGDDSRASSCAPNTACAPCDRVTFIRNIPPQGIVINTPGKYKICNSITWNPDINARVGIIVNTSNVDLDYNGYTVAQDPANTKQNNVGLVVSVDQTDVNIHGGIIQGISGYGIKLFEGDSYITIQDMKIAACGARGSFTDFSGTGFSMMMMMMQGGATSGGIELRGIPDNNVTHVLIDNVSCVDNVSPVIVTGLFGGYVDQIVVKNSTFSDNTGVLTGIGATFLLPTNIDFLNNHNNNNIATAPMATSITRGLGVLMGSPNRARIDGNQANGNIGNFEGAGIAMDEVFNTQMTILSESVVLSNNVANDNAINDAGGLLAEGYNIRQGNVVKNCVASYNVGNPGAFSMGFLLRNPIGLLVEDCQAYYNTASFGSFGFFDFAINDGSIVQPFPDRKNTVLRNCVAAGQTVTAGAGFGFPNIAVGICGGFLAGQSVEGTIYENCISEGNTCTDGLNGFGFLMIDHPEPLIKDCIARGNDVGIQLDYPGITQVPSNFGIIEQNVSYDNNAAGIVDAVAANKKNVYKKNQSYNNGATGASNYAGLPVGTPVRTWVIGAAPAATDNNGLLDYLDNMDIRV